MLNSCNEQVKNGHTPPKFVNVLDDFKGIPEEVDGCSCYFSENKNKFEKELYLFAAGYDSIGFVSIDHQLVKLKLTTSGRGEHSFGDYDHTDIYRSLFYKVTVDIKYDHSLGEEVWWNQGIITIETTDGKRIVKEFVGECGC